jgi:hypothetical protein
MPAQPPEELLQVGQRDALALANGSERDGALFLAEAEIDHGGNGKTTFGGKSHLSAS